MKKYKYLSYVFLLLAVLLSNVMCAAVAYNYCNLQWGTRVAGFSAPASIAFYLGIPYVAGMLICIGAACFFHRQWRGSL